MSVSAVADELWDVAFELEQEGEKLENKCKGQASRIEELTVQFGKSRAEVLELRNRMKRMEEEAVKLKQLLMEKGEPVDVAEGQGDKKGGRDPSDIFPEKVWNLIFGHVKEPQDLKSCYQTCTKFMWMLQEKRSTFLFLDVLKVMQNQDEDEMNLADYQSFRPAEMINCRRVCHAWKQCVDTYLQENCPFNEPVDDDNQNAPTALKFTLSQNDSWSNDPVLRNLSADINPIISRYVTLIYTGTPDPRQDITIRQKALCEFLQKFGHHVWHFKVVAQPEDLSFTSWYASLLTWLRLMPNLKSLHFCHLDHSSDHSVVGCLKENPFPALQSLESLALDYSPVEILESILTANPHVEKLQFLGSETTLSEFKLDKLKEVILADGRLSYKTLIDVNWHLRKLTLAQADSVQNWMTLFRTLEKFAGTLLELDLAMTGPGPDPEARLRLKLPNVRDLKLKIKRCFSSIDFILPLVNLERLKVNLTEMNRLGSEGSDSDYVRVAKIEDMRILRVVIFLMTVLHFMIPNGSIVPGIKRTSKLITLFYLF